MLAGAATKWLAAGLAERPQTRSGAAAFRASWEDEQQRPAFQLCFGSDRDAESLMEQSCFIQACEALYTPLISAMVPERRRRG